MFKVTYVIVAPEGEDPRSLVRPDEREILNAYQYYAAENGCIRENVFEKETNTAIVTYFWPDKASYESFKDFANVIDNFEDHLSRIQSLVTQRGGQMTRTEEEL